MMPKSTTCTKSLILQVRIAAYVSVLVCYKLLEVKDI